MTETVNTESPSTQKSSTTSSPQKLYQPVMFTGHHAYIITIAKLCKEGGKFTDVVIQCEDGNIAAHRLVLASCSSFLRETFLTLPEGLPEITIMVPNIKREVVSTLIDFLYTGRMVLAPSNTCDLQQLVHILQIDPQNVRIETESEERQKRLIQSKITHTLGVKIKPPIAQKAANAVSVLKSGEKSSSPSPVRSSKRRASQDDSKNSPTSGPPQAKEPRTGSVRGRARTRGGRGRGRMGPSGGGRSANNSISDPTGFHDMSNVETWVCAICECYDPVLPASMNPANAPPTEWIGCDCNRWFHQYCTKLKTIDENFSCNQIKMKCLPTSS